MLAIRAASARLRAFSFRMAADRRLRTVPSERNSVRAILGWSTRILRYLPTNLSTPEIAEQTYLSVNTVKTHMRHLNEKLGAHSRGEAV